MSVESFASREEFPVVAAGDENLSMISHCGLKEREWTGGELVGFEEGKFVLGEFGAGFGLEFAIAVLVGRRE